MSDISKIRNVAFVGPHHAGKTTLVEALLAQCGAIVRRGSVQHGTTVTDCEPEAIKHVQSVCTGFAYAKCGELDITLIDTPGFIDFFEETKQSLLAADAAVVVIDAEPSRLVQTAALVDLLEARNLPHLFFVNKLRPAGRRLCRYLIRIAVIVRPSRRRAAPPDRRRRRSAWLYRPGRTKRFLVQCRRYGTRRADSGPNC